jgi:predicted DNA-binding transcriptional regulator AlpA
MKMGNFDDDALLSVTDILNLTRWKSRVTLYRKCKSGDFPNPRQLGDRSVRWRAAEVQQWLKDLPTHRY